MHDELILSIAREILQLALEVGFCGLRAGTKCHCFVLPELPRGASLIQLWTGGVYAHY
jgi:hypothetical protein